MTDRKSPVGWCLSVTLLFVLFGAMRFVHLADRPMHNDEGVNGFFTDKLLRSNDYKYDPRNYHGPTLYYFQWLPSKIFGLTVFSARITTACASLLFLAGFLFCRPFLGPSGTMVALLFAGLSTDILFYSRYFIHETYVLLFTFGIFLGSLRYVKTKEPVPAYLAVLSAALLFCTKETGVLHMGVMGSAGVVAVALGKDGNTGVAKEYLRPLRRHWFWMILSAVGVWGLLFSSFFRNMNGLKDSFAAYIPWLKQSVESGHEKAWSYYITQLLWPYEPGLMTLALAGTVAAVVRNEVKGWFLLLWAIGTIAVYSMIPYKTPWLVVNFILPLALLAGYGAQSIVDWVRLIQSRDVKRRLSFSVVFLIAAAISFQIPLLLKVNYIEADNERHPQIYVHTSNDIFRLIRDINEMARKTGEGNRMLVQVVSPQYWPLPFYLKDFPSAKFWGRVDIGGPLDAPLVLAAIAQRSEVRTALRESYSIQNYTLRPGFYLDLWMSNAVLDRFQPPLTVPDLLNSRTPGPSLMTGLREEIFMNETTRGSPLLISDGKRVLRFSHDSEDKKPVKPPYSVRWTGYIKIPKSGVHRFSLDSDDGSKLSIDGAELVDNTGHHALRRRSRNVNLSAGFHSLEITYSDIGGTAEFDFYWKPPDSLEERVPGRVLFSER